MDCITVELIRQRNESWGIQVSGEGPCYVESVAKGSPGDEAGLQKGDYIISINGVSVYNAAHKLVVKLIAESDRIVRLRILPNEEQSELKPQEDVAPSSRDMGSEDWSSKPSSEEHTQNQYENSFNIGKKKKSKKNAQKTYDMQVRYDKDNDPDQLQNQASESAANADKKSISIEQNGFIVTREDQQQFDENYELEGNFAGRKASVAGAFTGDFNVIMSEKADGDVRGVRSRVLAGIQHFSFDETGQSAPIEERGKIILYTTSLGIHRSVAQKCEDARKILHGYRVKFELRDIFIDPIHKDRLFQRLGLAPGKFPNLPMLFIDGVLVGSHDEIQEMSDCGDLRIRLQDFQKYNVRKHCPTCEGSGIVACRSCRGKGFRQKNRFTKLKCSSCSEQGKVECGDCL